MDSTPNLSPSADGAYYLTFLQIAAWLHLSRATLHRRLDARSGRIGFAGDRYLQSVKIGELRLVPRNEWERFVAVDLGLAAAQGPNTEPLLLPPPPPRKKPGRPRRSA